MQRKLDPSDGTWHMGVGRKLKTNREMLTRDFSTSTLFQNPLSIVDKDKTGLQSKINFIGRMMMLQKT